MFQIAPFDPTKKKKKKKVVIQDAADDSVDKLAEKTDNLSGLKYFDDVLWTFVSRQFLHNIPGNLPL